MNLKSASTASSPLVKPVTRRPRKSVTPPSSTTFSRPAGPWHTAPTGLPARQKAAISFLTVGSVALSNIGPWPPGKKIPSKPS